MKPSPPKKDPENSFEELSRQLVELTQERQNLVDEFDELAREGKTETAKLHEYGQPIVKIDKEIEELKEKLVIMDPGKAEEKSYQDRIKREGAR